MLKKLLSKKVLSLILCFSICLTLFGMTSAAANAATTATVTDIQKDTIYRLTSIFENSTTELQYTYIENIGDGRGYTFGFPGFCSGTYDGTMFLKKYKALNPNNTLVKYIPTFEYIDSLPHPDGLCSVTTGLEKFPADFQACGSDPDFKQAQHDLVDELYWNPSQVAANEVGAKYPVTCGELYDSFINHGEDGARDIINQTNKAVGKIINGTDEKTWLDKFLSIRLGILQSDSTWSEAVDRVKVYQKLLNTDNNVNLARPIKVTCYGDTFTISGDTVTPPPTSDTSLAFNKPVTFSGQQEGNEATHAVDGDTSNRWSSQVFPQWINVDLGAVYNINKTEVVPYMDRAYQFKVEVSADGTNYTQVVDRTANTTGGPSIANTFTGINARYVKLTVTGCDGDTTDWTSISEFRVFGDTATPPPSSEPETGYSYLTAMANQSIVCAENYGDDPLIANRTSAGDWESFQIINNSDGTISLLSKVNGKYVCADLNQSAKLIARSSTIDTWEKFQKVTQADGTIALKAMANNQYVCCDLNLGAVLYANREAVGGAWETFIVTNVNDTDPTQPTDPDFKPVVLGYIPTWSFNCYKTVDLSKLTHICIAFAEPDTNGNLSLDVSDSDINGCVAMAHAANVKVLLSLGGGSGNPNYKNLLTSKNRAAFCDKIVQYMNKYKLDGVDVDLEINQYNNIDSNWEPFVNDLYSRLKPQGKLLTAAVADWEGDLLPKTAFSKFDLVNIMAYEDYQAAVRNLDYFVNKKGVDRQKAVLGIAFFGYTSSGQYIGYKDIIAKYPDAWNVDSYAGIKYVGAASVAKQTLLGKQYGGVMIWDMSLDASGDRSLLKVIGTNIK
ncbi:MAG: chitosanase [Anaerocolumna sp.]